MAAQAAERPNILLILCDDLGYADVGFNGAKDIRTPALDRLASNGTIFSSAYAVHPFCGPSRMGLMSGRYPHKFGGPFNLPPSNLGIEEYNRKGIPVSETLISTVLKNAGYTTGLVGKWHLGMDRPFHPNRRGFDDFYGFLHGGHCYLPEKYLPIYDRAVKAGKGLSKVNDYYLPLEHNGKPTREDQYLTDALSDHAIRFVKQAAKRESPFFLFLAYNAPHTPLEATEEDLAVYAHIKDEKRRTYAAMVHAVDRGIDELTAALEETGQLGNTLIVFLSDNGGKIGAGADNTPLTRGKGSTNEGGFRVPMFFHWPGHVPAGRKYDHPVTALDFYPTFAGLAQAAIPKGKELDGVDIWVDFLAGRSARKGGMIYAVRHHAAFSNVGIRRDQWKLLRVGTADWQLFNITDDIAEQNDLSAHHPELVSTMVATAHEWSRTHTQPEWFHARKAGDTWRANNMPNAKTFTLEPYRSNAARKPAVEQSGSKPPAKKKLAKGDSTLEHFIRLEKAKWDKHGWPWNQARVEALFRTIDSNGDGIASGREKKTYWENLKK